MLAKTSGTRFSDRRSESERGGTGDRFGKRGESRARKVQNGGRDCWRLLAIVGVKVIGIFTPTIKLLALRGRVKFSF